MPFFPKASDSLPSVMSAILLPYTSASLSDTLPLCWIVTWIDGENTIDCEPHCAGVSFGSAVRTSFLSRDPKPFMYGSAFSRFAMLSAKSISSIVRSCICAVETSSPSFRTVSSSFCFSFWSPPTTPPWWYFG